MNTDTDFATQIVSAIRSVLGDRCAPLHEPSFDGNEWLYVKQCLDSSFVSSVGSFVDRFEADLSLFTGAKYVVAVVNGTSALHIALKLAGVREGDEVLMPALTFIATANAAVYCNATPHFVDSNEKTLGMDALQLRDYLKHSTDQRSAHCVNRLTGKIVRALVPMHTFGHAVDMDALLAIAHDFNIVLIEDAAESLGSYYNGQHTGTFGSIGTLSFNGNKTITTGGGGAILTNDRLLARQAKHLTTTAKMPHAWEFRHDQVGFNYRLPNLNAALGCAQLENLPKKLAAKRELFTRYQAAFSQVKGLKLMEEPLQSRSNYWLQTLILSDEKSDQLTPVLKATNAAGYMTRPAWGLMSEQAPFKDCPAMELNVSQSLASRLLNIPSSPGLLSAKS